MFELFYYIHPSKEHGLTNQASQWAIDSNIDLLFLPDAGSSDFENHFLMKQNNIMTICLDHHSSDACSLNAIVVNSQLSLDYNNKEFSGVGITYKFLKMLDLELGINMADDFLDLVGLGNIADSVSMVEEETRYYVLEGIKNLQNEVLKEMIYQFIGKWDKVNINSLAFNVNPVINGTIRAGSKQEKIDLFEALIGHNLDDIHINEKARSEANKQETFLKKVVRQCKNAKTRQNNAKKKWINKIKEQVATEGISNNTIITIVFKKRDKFDTSLTGVVASSLVSYYKRPVIILTENQDSMCYGSLRGYDSFSLTTKSLLLQTNLFEWIQGHENAAGVCIKKENLAKLNTEINKIHKFTETAIPVDFILPANKMSKLVVENIHSYEKYWGKGISAPVLAVEGVEIDFEKVKISSGGMIKLSQNGVDYTQFTADPIFEQYVETNTLVTMNIIGTASINSFMGKESYQFIIEKFEITKTEDSTKMKYKSLF